MTREACASWGWIDILDYLIPPMVRDVPKVGDWYDAFDLTRTAAAFNLTPARPYRAIDRALIEHVRTEEPDFVRSARCQYLDGEISRLSDELSDDRAWGLSQPWDVATLCFLRDSYRDKRAILRKHRRELASWSRPERPGRITEAQIEQARNFPLIQLIDGAKPGDKMLCVSHKDTNPSMTIFEDHAHCFSCGFHADAIQWLMTTRGLKFIDAVKALIL